MSHYVVHEGTPCPDCCGTGYTATSICETCDEHGVIGREVAHVPDGWLYLPHRQVWLSPAHIVAITRAEIDTSDGRVPAYLITPTRSSIHGVSGIIGGLAAQHPDDIAAVTAWLRGRM